MMNMELYDALICANVPETKARKAAMSVSGHDRAGTKVLMAEIKADIHVLKWMAGINMALTMSLILQAVA